MSGGGEGSMSGAAPEYMLLVIEIAIPATISNGVDSMSLHLTH